MSDEQPAPVQRPWWHWALAAAGTGAFIVALIWGPWWIEGHHLKEGGKLVSSAGIIVTGFRTMLVALAAGGFTWAGLMYTRRNHQLARQQFEHAQKQFEESQKQFETTLLETQKRDELQAELTREGQVTDRYVEAIKLLASKQLHERLGGIYSLERIMNDSEKDRSTIIEVLAAFARSTQLIFQEGSASGDENANATTDPEITEPRVLQPLFEDVRAALNVLGRNWTEDRPRADLRRINVDGIDMREANLTGADLSYAILDQAYLYDAVLNNAALNWAQLNRANLNEARLNGAQLRGAELNGAQLGRAQLNGAQLGKAQLNGAQLIRAELHGAMLTQANLNGAVLVEAELNGATLNWAELNEAELNLATLNGANLYCASLNGAQLIGATLNDAELEETELHQASGLLVDQVVVARITSSTLLPDDIADDDGIKARVAQCEAARVAGEEPPPWTGEGSTPD